MQLNRAIDLYLAGSAQDLVCALTLAGAAEEILARLVEEHGGTPSFQHALDMLCGMHEAAFPKDPPDRKVYATMRNKARNDFKHITDSEPFRGDLERETGNMIRRAVENHRRLGCGFVEKYRAFQSKLLERDRNRRQGA